MACQGLCGFFYRVNNVANSLSFVTLLLAHRFNWCRFEHFDLQLSAISAHCLIFQCLTRSHTEQLLGLNIGPPAYDEAYQIIMCLMWWAAVMPQAEIDVRYQLVLGHVNIIAWMGFGLRFGTPSATMGMFIKLSISYYLILGLLIDHNRRADQRRYDMLVLHHRLEQQVNQERGLARYEREAALAKISAAEQSALRSFMAAVFDIFGHLEWIRTGVDEPKLCFSPTEQNTSLNALMKQDLSGKPLDALLGKAPPVGEAREKWHRERQRLWNYAVVEAEPQCEEDNGERVNNVARKLALTCVDSTGSPFEAEILMRPGSGAGTLFGLLVLTRREEIMPTSEASEAILEAGVATERLMREAIAFKPVGETSWESTSRASSEDWQHYDNAQVSAWVDASDDALPIVACSATFSWLSRSGEGETLKLMDMVINKESFANWLRSCLSCWVHGENQTANPCFLYPVRLCTLASSRSFVEIKSLVQFASADLYEFERETAGKNKCMKVPVKLSFMSLTMKGLGAASQLDPERGGSWLPLVS